MLEAQLAMSPTERLRQVERFASDAESLRNARRIQAKEAADRPKDRHALLYLRQLQAMSSGGED